MWALESNVIVKQSENMQFWAPLFYGESIPPTFGRPFPNTWQSLVEFYMATCEDGVPKKREFEQNMMAFHVNNSTVRRWTGEQRVKYIEYWADEWWLRQTDCLSVCLYCSVSVDATVSFCARSYTVICCTGMSHHVRRFESSIFVAQVRTLYKRRAGLALYRDLTDRPLELSMQFNPLRAGRALCALI